MRIARPRSAARSSICPTSLGVAISSTLSGTESRTDDSPADGSTSTPVTTGAGSGWDERARAPNFDAAGRDARRGSDHRAAGRGGGSDRRARRSTPALRLARAHLDRDPHRPHRVLRTERGLVGGAWHAPPSRPAVRPRRALRLLPVFSGARHPLGTLAARGRRAHLWARPSRDPPSGLVRELSRAGEARRPLPQLSGETPLRHLAVAHRRCGRRGAAPRPVRGVRAPRRRWLRRVWTHHPAGPQRPLRHRRRTGPAHPAWPDRALRHRPAAWAVLSG